LNLDKADPTKSVLAFSVYPASSNSPAIDQSGRPVRQEGPDVTNYSLITFLSERAEATSDGSLKVTGKLTVTHVEREMDLAPTEAYVGPVYGAAVVQKSAREESFILAVPAYADEDAEAGAKAEISASGNISREEFPQMVTAVLATHWPTVVQDERWDTAPSPGEGYSGIASSGSVVNLPSLPFTYTGSGEDYLGPVNDVEFGNNFAIDLHMQLAQEHVQPSTVTGE
jgi:hypothetical protein